MKLRYVAIHMDFDSEINELFREKFNLQTRFINNFLSKEIRKIKLELGNDINMISVVPSKNITNICRMVGDKALQVRIPFEEDRFNESSMNKLFIYYLQLLEKAYDICSTHLGISLEPLIELHKKFRDNNFENKWIHKKKRFKKYGLEAILNCSFEYDFFRLQLKINSIKDSKELVLGTVIKTLPDEVHFVKLFKDIIIENDYLIITEFQDSPKFKFLLSDIISGNFKFQILDNGLKYLPLE